MASITWFLTLLMMAGLILNESIGSEIMMFGVLGWIIYGGIFADRVLKWFVNVGIVCWLVPLIALLSYFWSWSPDWTLRSAAETLVMVAIMVMISKTVKARDFVMILFLIFAGIGIVSVPFNHVSLDGRIRVFNLTGIFDNKNTFSMCSAFLVMTSFAMVADAKRHWSIRLCAVPLIGLGFVQNIQSHSVAATVVLLVSLAWGAVMYGMFLFPTKYRSAYVLNMAVFGAIAMVLGVFIVMMFSEQLLALVNKDSTLTGRTELWDYAANFITENHIGVGYNAFWNRSNPDAVQLYGNLSDVPLDMTFTLGFSFHNLFYEVAVELGVVGVIAGALFIGQSIFYSVRWLRVAPSIESVFCFAFVVYMLVDQTQGYDIFSTFSPSYGIFLVIFFYGQKAMKQTVVRVRTNTDHNFAGLESQTG